MKITINNHSNKKRSKKAMQDLKDFAELIAHRLDISDSIKHIKLRYTTKWNGYYPKNKPLAGFFKAYSNGVVKLDFVGHWDGCQIDRKEAIIHELTHAKQIIERRLIIYKNGKQMKWNGEYYKDWKKFNLDHFGTLTPDQQLKYTKKHLPWEREVLKNINKYSHLVEK